MLLKADDLWRFIHANLTCRPDDLLHQGADARLTRRVPPGPMPADFDEYDQNLASVRDHQIPSHYGLRDPTRFQTSLVYRV